MDLKSERGEGCGGHKSIGAAEAEGCNLKRNVGMTLEIKPKRCASGRLRIQFGLKVVVAMVSFDSPSAHARAHVHVCRTSETLKSNGRFVTIAAKPLVGVCGIVVICCGM